MKNYLFLILFSFVSYSYSKAAEREDSLGDYGVFRYELSFGAGFGSHIQLFEGKTFSQVDGHSATPISSYSGTYNINAKVFSSRTFVLGIAMVFENEQGITQALKYPRYSHDVFRTGVFKRSIYTVAFEFLFNYKFDEDWGRTYGYIGYGYSYLNEVYRYDLGYYTTQYENGVNKLGNSLEVSKDRRKGLFQICVWGFSSPARLCGFVELGYGYKGIVNGGIAYKL